MGVVEGEVDDWQEYVDDLGEVEDDDVEDICDDDVEDDDEGEVKPGVFSRIAKIFDFDEQQKGESGSQYRVLLQQHTDELVRVMVRDNNGLQLPQQDADRLLRRIRANLL